MHPRMQELLGELDQSLEAMRSVYLAIPRDRRTTRPHPDRWSAAEIVGHLAIVDQRMAKRMGDAITAATLSPERETTSVLSSIDRQRVRDRTSRRSAPEPTHPINVDAETVLDGFGAARAELRSAFARGDGLALGELTLPHPAFGPLTIYEWMAFAADHTLRHTDQMRENEETLSAAARTPD